MATTDATHTAGILPATNDLAAVIVIGVTYLIRFAAVTPEVTVPWWLTVTTDVFLPVLAGAWLWVAAMYALYQRAA